MRLALLPLLLGLALPSLAQVRPAPADAPLPRWEQLTATQQQSLVAPLRDRWNDSPDQRARMLEHAERWQGMTDDERSRARHGVKRWQHMSPEKRDEMRALYGKLHTLPDAERAALRERWKTMTPEQKRSWVQANPAPADPGPKRSRREP